MANFGNLAVKLTADAAQFRSEFAKAVSGAESAMGKIGSAVGGLKSKLAALGVGISFGAMFSESIKAAMEAEQASARLDAVLKATGYSAGLTKKQLDEMADSMSRSTQFDDESIRNASAELLKFGNIQGNVFRDALKLSADVAAFSGGDIASAAQDVGKALLDVENASRLLKNAGVKLSDQQKDQIKAFSDAGETAKAQRLILDALKNSYDGVGDALNTGLTRATKDSSKAWGEFTEAFGRTETFQTTATLLSGVVTLALEDLTRKMEGMNDELSRTQRTAVGKVGGPAFKSADFTKKEKDTQSAEIGAANKRLKEAEDAEYARQKKMADEAKKHAGEMAAIAKRQNEAMRSNDQWVSDSLTDQIAEANKEQAKWAETARETARGYVDMVSPADELVRKMQAVEFLMETIDEKTGKPFLSADQGQLALLDLNEQIDKLDEVKETTKEVSGFARDMGLSFSSAFEDAIVRGAKFSDMLKGLSDDIARIVIRKSITEPLGNAVSGAVSSSGMGDWFKNLLPSFDVGTDYVPRDMIAQIHKGERIVPAAQNKDGTLGGTTNHFVVDMRGASVEAVQRLENLVMSINGSIERRALGAMSQARTRGAF